MTIQVLVIQVSDKFVVYTTVVLFLGAPIIQNTNSTDFGATVDVYVDE